MGWFLTALTMFFISSVLLIAVLHFGRVVPRSDPSVLLAFLTLFGAATIAQAFLISTFFKLLFSHCCEQGRDEDDSTAAKRTWRPLLGL